MFDQQAIEASLRTAGISVLDFMWSAPTLPASAAWMLTACGLEDGRIDCILDLDEPDLMRKANIAWWQLVAEHGLLDQDRSFLVSVGPVDQEFPAKPHWARVRLEADWDIIGGGTDYGVLGGPPGRPGFVMMSLDESVLTGGTTSQDSISVIALPRPAAAKAIQKFLGRLG
jgi:hypothetical protein